MLRARQLAYGTAIIAGLGGGADFVENGKIDGFAELRGTTPTVGALTAGTLAATTHDAAMNAYGEKCPRAASPGRVKLKSEALEGGGTRWNLDGPIDTGVIVKQPGSEWLELSADESNLIAHVKDTKGCEYIALLLLDDDNNQAVTWIRVDINPLNQTFDGQTLNRAERNVTGH